MTKKILVVDDEEWIANLIQDYLVEHGFDVVIASNLRSAREQLTAMTLPDLIVLDVMLPDGNGIEFLSEIRATPRTKTLPAIIISAHRIQVQDRIVGFETGADDYLVKPFDLKEFVSRIERLLQRVKTVQDTPTQPGVHASIPPMDPFVRGPSPSHQLRDIFRHEKQSEEPKGQDSPASAPVNSKIKMVLWKKGAALLLNPEVFLRGEKLRLDWGVIGLLVGIFSLGMGLQRGIELRSIGAGVFSILGFAAASTVLCAGLASLIHWILGLQQRFLSFRGLCLAFGAMFGPLALASILGVFSVAAGGGALGDFTAGPLLLMPMQASSPVFGFLLRRLDAFEWWGMWLVAEFLALAGGFDRKKVLGWVLMGWIVAVGCVGLIVGALR